MNLDRRAGCLLAFGRGSVLRAFRQHPLDGCPKPEHAKTGSARQP